MQGYMMIGRWARPTLTIYIYEYKVYENLWCVLRNMDGYGYGDWYGDGYMDQEFDIRMDTHIYVYTIVCIYIYTD